MKPTITRLATIVLGLFISMSVYAQSVTLPVVFLIGENEESYTNMTGDYNTLLLSVCNNSMDEAYDKWMDLQMKIEDYADSINYDINGVKVWINVFWNKDGSIEHIVYYPKPNSRNMDFDKFTEFLAGFTTTYNIGNLYEKNFSHYGSASFPSMPRALGKG